MLTQAQTIRALADALEWFEKELGWGVPPASQPHLTGRLGELYVAMMTRGQLAERTNQIGYDVVSASGERISVKTVTTSGHVSFNANTFSEVDRVVILRINVDVTEPSIEEILDCSATDVKEKCYERDGRFRFGIPPLPKEPKPLTEQRIINHADHGPWELRQYESGAMAVLEGGRPVQVVKPILREIAREVGVDVLNGNGNPKNTRALGNDVIRAVLDR